MQEKIWTKQSIIGLALLILLFTILCWYASWHAGYYSMDDAYISFRYAKNLVEGNGLVFNVGERVEGYTNFLWTLLAAFIIWLGLPVGFIMNCLGFFAGLLTLIFTALLSRQLLSEERFLIAPALLTVSGSFVTWSISGMETSFFTMWIIMALFYFIMHAQNHRTLWIPSIFMLLAALTRPEGVLIAFFLSLYLIFRYYSSIKKKEPQQSIKRNQALTFIILFSVLYGTYFVWRVTYYGYLFPNTFYAKTGFNFMMLVRGIKHFNEFFMVMHLPFLIALIYYLTKHLFHLFPKIENNTAIIHSENGYSWLTAGNLLFVIIIVYTAYIIYLGGDWSPGRYYAPILPLLCMLTAYYLGIKPTQVFNPNGWLFFTLVLTLIMGSALIYHYYLSKYSIGLPEGSWLIKEHDYAWITIISTIIIGLLFILTTKLSWPNRIILYFVLIYIFGITYWVIGEYRMCIKEGAQEEILTGLHLSQSAPQGATVALGHAGYGSYYSGLYVYDLYGINSEEIAHRETPMGYMMAGHDKYAPEIILSYKPYYVYDVHMYQSLPQFNQEYEEWDYSRMHNRFVRVYIRKDKTVYPLSGKPKAYSTESIAHFP